MTAHATNTKKAPQALVGPRESIESVTSLRKAHEALAKGHFEGAITALRTSELTIEALRSDSHLCNAAAKGIRTAKSRGDGLSAERIARVFLPESPEALRRTGLELWTPLGKLPFCHEKATKSICQKIIQRCKNPDLFRKEEWDGHDFLTTELNYSPEIPLEQTLEIYAQPGRYAQVNGTKNGIEVAAQIRPKGFLRADPNKWYLKTKLLTERFPFTTDTHDRISDAMVDTIYHELCHVAQDIYRSENASEKDFPKINNDALDQPPGVAQRFGYLIENPDESSARLYEAEFRAMRLRHSIEEEIDTAVADLVKLPPDEAFTATESSIVSQCLKEHFIRTGRSMRLIKRNRQK